MKVDVIINVYGKPQQTLVTLHTLMKHSGQHIDKIYFIEEAQQPFNDSVSQVLQQFPNIVHTRPGVYQFINTRETPRESVRYQYGFDHSNKEWVFITHNDVLYTGDVIGGMISKIGDGIVGVGEIGQCWNCPAKAKGLCSGEKFYEWNPTYEDVIALCDHMRTYKTSIDSKKPKPLPECRLNEWACLVKRDASLKHPFFGDYVNGVDLGCAWFRHQHIQGRKFVNYKEHFTHMPFTNQVPGFQVQQNINLYKNTEAEAKKFLENNFSD